MDLARSALAHDRGVRGRDVPDVGCEAVPGVERVGRAHVAVARHLGDDRGGGDRGALRVAVDDRAVRRRGRPELEAVDERTRRRAGTPRAPRAARAGCTVQPVAVDHRRPGTRAPRSARRRRGRRGTARRASRRRPASSRSAARAAARGGRAGSRSRAGRPRRRAAPRAAPGPPRPLRPRSGRRVAGRTGAASGRCASSREACLERSPSDGRRLCRKCGKSARFCD